MSSVNSPNGLRPVGRIGNAPYEGGATALPLTTDNAAALAVGDVVALVAGSIVPVSANAAAGTLSANTPVGVIVGIDYYDPINRRPFVNSQILAAHAIANLGYQNVIVHVVDDPSARFSVQANGSVAANQVGGTIGLGGFGAADLLNRTSRVYADTATLNQTSGSTEPFRIVGIDKDVANAAGDAFTRVIVQYNFGAHQYQLAGAH